MCVKRIFVLKNENCEKGGGEYKVKKAYFVLQSSFKNYEKSPL